MCILKASLALTSQLALLASSFQQLSSSQEYQVIAEPWLLLLLEFPPCSKASWSDVSVCSTKAALLWPPWRLLHHPPSCFTNRQVLVFLVQAGQDRRALTEWREEIASFELHG
ncbi:hypothetical protein YC2023_094353 [Brassica napus]